jgi:1-acyl-sn-glycerol-3-phosphate acyltransferase
MHRYLQRSFSRHVEEEETEAQMSKLAASKTLVHTARITLPTVVDAVLGRIDPDMLDQRLASWAQKMIDEARITIVVRGREHLGYGETFILMSNHQSHYDIPVLYRAIPRRLRMVAKAELFRIPLFGRAMRAAGFVKVNRGDRRQAVQSLRDSASMLEHGTLLWIAPEGTRSVTGELGSFKSGGFHMALETGHRILPIAIDGTRNVLQSGTIDLHRGHHVTVTILPPIDPKAFGPLRRKDLMETVRNTIAAAMPPASL